MLLVESELSFWLARDDMLRRTMHAWIQMTRSWVVPKCALPAPSDAVLPADDFALPNVLLAAEPPWLPPPIGSSDLVSTAVVETVVRTSRLRSQYRWQRE